MSHKPIRSFVRRGRVNPAQQCAIDELWSHYGINTGCGKDAFKTLFPRIAPIRLEIGFGMGDALLSMAAQNPHYNYLGIDVYRPGIGHLLQQIQQQDLQNIRVVEGDAIDLLQNDIPRSTLDTVYLFFPDPWPKKRHHKRRIVQNAFVKLVANKLEVGGIFHMATDWQAYAEHMLAKMELSPSFVNMAKTSQFSLRPTWRPLTKFERRARQLGNSVWDLIFEKVG